MSDSLVKGPKGETGGVAINATRKIILGVEFMVFPFLAEEKADRRNNSSYQRSEFRESMPVQ